MGIFARKFMLAVGVWAVIGTGATGAADAAFCTSLGQLSFPLYLDISGTNFVLGQTLSPGSTTKFVDSPALSRSGGNPYHEMGEWETFTVIGQSPACSLTSVDPLTVWLGLRNGDDQGTNFDLKAEVRVGNVLVATAERLCIKGATRNPARALEIVNSFPGPLAHPPGGQIATVTLYARIGTPQSTCGGHSSATGLRLYYGSDERDSGFQINFRVGS